MNETECSILNGFTILKDYNLMNFSSKNDPYDGETCNLGYQCAEQNLDDRYLGLPGYCEYCEVNQWCLPGSIALVDYAGKSNICPDGYLCDGDESVMCPEGTICSENRFMDCTDAASKSLIWELLVGTYCPAGTAELQMCPVGSYCPNQGTIKECPDGWFCMRKSEEKWLECRGCDTGEDELKPDPALFMLLLLILFHFGLFAVLHFLVDKEYLPKEFSRPMKSTCIWIMSKFGCKRGETDETHSLYRDFQKEKNILLDDILETHSFSKMDADSKGFVTLEQIQEAVSLKSSKQKSRLAFLMNVTSEEEQIDEEHFDESFPVAYLSARHMDPAEDEVKELFETIDMNQTSTISNFDLYNSSLGHFLVEGEVNSLIGKFRVLKSSKRRTIQITRDEFIENYTSFLDEITAQNQDQGTSMLFKDLKLDVLTSTGEQKTILNSVSGEVKPIEMTAVMGGSGAGKTSLLNALCGRAFYGTVTGEILVNGHTGALEKLKDSLGFVPQDDIVYPELTVRENFLYSGRFRLPLETPVEEIEDLVDETVANLGLTRCSDTIVGDVKRRGISGGEKKRVNIGLELMGRPKILFLDEPTSGLDSSSSSLVMQSLRVLCSRSRITVVAVIHQPRKFVFNQFDNVILLGAGGYIAYSGPIKGTIPYFQSLGFHLPPGENIADFLIDAISGLLIPVIAKKRNSRLVINFEQEWKRWYDSLDKEDVLTVSPLPPVSQKPLFYTQFKLQLERRWLIVNRTWGDHMYSFFILLLGMVVMTLLAGVLDVVQEEADPDEDCNAGTLAFDEFYGTVMFPLENNNTDEYQNYTETQICRLFRYPSDLKSSVSKMAQYGQNTNDDVIGFTLMIGLVTCLIIGIDATRPIGNHLLEFRRESGSGYIVLSFFLAMILVFILENIVMVIFAALIVMFFRVTIASKFAFLLNFVLMGFSAGSWGFFYSTWISPDSAILAVGLHMILGCYFSGATDGVKYEDMYDNALLNGFTALISPVRFFVETYQVNEYKCLKPQAGFTSGFMYLFGITNFDDLNVAQNDPNNSVRTCDGWYWNVPPAIFAGLTIYCLSAILLHCSNRGKMFKPSFRNSLNYKEFLRKFILALGKLFSLALITILLTTVTRGKLDDDLYDKNVFCDLLLNETSKQNCDQIYNSLDRAGWFENGFGHDFQNKELPEFCQGMFPPTILTSSTINVVHSKLETFEIATQ